jgi:hypothetical protein
MPIFIEDDGCYEDTLNHLFLDAARDGNLDGLIECLNIDACDLTADGRNFSALHFASRGGHLDVAKYLVEQLQHHAHRRDD